MATYVLIFLPTAILSVALGVALGWITWGRGRRAALRAHRDSIRRFATEQAREIADRDVTVEILRDELAAEASEVARLRRMLGKAPSESPSPSRPTESPRNASVLAVAAARAASSRGNGDRIESSAAKPVVSRRSLRRAARS